MAGYPLRVGESIIPLFISVPLKRPGTTDEPARPVRWIDTHSPAIQARFRDLAYFIAQHASYDTATTVPSRAKGKQATRSLHEGYKPLQVLVQPECGLYRPSGTFVENDDALCFYDMDSLPITRLIEAHEHLRVLMDQGRAFVWMNAVLRPKAAFWVRLRGAPETPQTLLNRVHQEIFHGDPEYAPALGPSDMWKSFVHSAEVLEGMRVFFEEAYRRHVQVVHDAAVARQHAWEARQRQELAEALTRQQPQAPELKPEDHPTSAGGHPDHPKSGFEDYIGEVDFSAGIPDGFKDYLDREFAPRLDHGLQFPLFEEPLPSSLFGRKASRLQELALRLALSMPGRLIGEGVGIPSTLVQKLAHQFYPGRFDLSFDESGNLDASGAAKAIGQLVRRGVLEVVDHRFRPGAVSKSYRAVHPELIRIAIERLGTLPGLRFQDRTVDGVDARWEELTGQALANTQIDGIRDQVIYRLTNLCPSFEVFEEAALRIPGMRERADRIRFLPSQWEAHVEKDRRRQG